MPKPRRILMAPWISLTNPTLFVRLGQSTSRRQNANTFKDFYYFLTGHWRQFFSRVCARTIELRSLRREIVEQALLALQEHFLMRSQARFGFRLGFLCRWRRSVGRFGSALLGLRAFINHVLFLPWPPCCHVMSPTTVSKEVYNEFIPLRAAKLGSHLRS